METNYIDAHTLVVGDDLDPDTQNVAVVKRDQDLAVYLEQNIESVVVDDKKNLSELLSVS